MSAAFDLATQWWQWQGERCPPSILKVLAAHAYPPLVEKFPDYRQRFGVETPLAAKPVLGVFTGPEDNPADEEPPSKEDWEKYQELTREPTEEEEELQKAIEEMEDEEQEEADEEELEEVYNEPDPPPEPVEDAFASRVFVLLPRNLAAVAKCCADASPRYALTGVSLQQKENGEYIAEATDGRILLRVTGTGDATDEYPEIPGFGEPKGDVEDGRLVIPSKSWEEAFKAAPKRGLKPLLTRVAVKGGKDEAVLASTNLEKASVMPTRLVEGRWPMTDEVFPKKKPALTVCIDPNVMIRLLTACKAFTDRVTLELRKDEPIKLTGVCSWEGQKIEGLIMPCAAAEGVGHGAK